MSRDPPHTPDEDLMEMARSGSKEAFLRLIARWERPLRRFLGVLGVRGHEAEDALQETFLRLFAYRSRYRRRDGRFQALVFRIARNASIDLARRRRRSSEWLSLHALDDGELEAEDPSRGWNERLDLRWAIEALPEKLWVVVALSVFHGLGYAEIAETLEVPLGTVKSRMHLAMSRLRELLEAGSRR